MPQTATHIRMYCSEKKHARTRSTADIPCLCLVTRVQAVLRACYEVLFSVGCVSGIQPVALPRRQKFQVIMNHGLGTQEIECKGTGAIPK